MISKDKKRLTITIKKNVYETMKEIAKESNITISRVVEALFCLAILNCAIKEKVENEKKNN